MKKKISYIFNPSYNKKRIKENSVRIILFLTAISAIIIIFAIIFFLLNNAFPFFNQVNIIDFIAGEKWNPTSANNPSYGALRLIVGTLLVTFGAMVIAIPLSIGSAIFISEIAPYRLKTILKPAVELLAGVPSVIYGYFGALVLVHWIEDFGNVASGETWLAGSILLGIMAIPTITSVAEDAISSVPRDYKEGSFALGANKWQTISKAIIPSALSGITAAVILGIGRAIGETIAVSMVAGSTPYGWIPKPLWNVFEPVKPITATIVGETPEVGLGTTHYYGLFALAVILLLISLIINMSATYILGRLKEKQTGKKSKKLSKLFSFKKLISIKNLDKIKKYFLILMVLVFCYIILVIFSFITGSIIILFIFIFYYINKKLSKKNVQNVWFALIFACIIIVVVFLGIIVIYIVSNGIGSINIEFLTGIPENSGRAGGILPAIMGTLYLVAGAIAIALPLGLCTAIYLIEYTREGKLTKIIRSAVDLLNGTPSIVFGLFGFAFLVLYLKFGFSLIAGQITLSFMIMPTIIRTSEEALKSVPQSLREGSYAVGATKWQTIRKIVLPPAAPGIITGTILGIGRAAGETAPVLLTCGTLFSKDIIPASFSEPVMSLTYYLYNLKRSVPNTEATTSGVALVLLLLIIGIYLIAIFIRNHYNKKMKW